MKRVAITIGGAVSLGSYEAGVMYELLAALKAHNIQSPGEERIVVDVLTGASAGGMTAAIAAQKMLFDAGSLDGADGNAFYLPWVREVSLMGLLEVGAGSSAVSLLSSHLVEGIARKHLTDRYSGSADLSRQIHPAAADAIQLGLAMSNLSGVDYAVETSSGEPFVYTRFQDEFIRTVDAKAGDTPELWQQIRDAAVACGAFPFAFRIQELLREDSEYARLGPEAFPPTSGRYAYTDGGVFQNE